MPVGISQPTVSEHMKVHLWAGLVRAKHINQWTFYKRNEDRMEKIKDAILASVINALLYRTLFTPPSAASRPGTARL